VIVPENVDVPRPVVIGQLSDAVNGVSSGNITIVDSSTVVVESFTHNSPQTGLYRLFTDRLVLYIDCSQHSTCVVIVIVVIYLPKV